MIYPEMEDFILIQLKGFIWSILIASTQSFIIDEPCKEDLDGNKENNFPKYETKALVLLMIKA
jgi:hypothetical protein